MFLFLQGACVNSVCFVHMYNNVESRKISSSNLIHHHHFISNIINIINFCMFLFLYSFGLKNDWKWPRFFILIFLNFKLLNLFKIFCTLQHKRWSSRESSLSSSSSSLLLLFITRKGYFWFFIKLYLCIHMGRTIIP
jgi:hypothetical protein